MNSHTSTLPGLLGEYQRRIEAALDAWLPDTALGPQRLHEAMRYATLGGGKRVRPLLVYATGVALGASPEGLDGPACAVELIHAYSLVHDDLPAMDDDDLRRGRPTCHRAFDEGTAILAGDALQSLAFYVLAHDGQLRVSDDRRLEMVRQLAHAAGSRGMAGGQSIDLQATGKRLDLTELENMHIHKTGALIRASVRLGALAAPAVAGEVKEGLDRFAKNIGLCFQVMDDILDVESDTETLGKSQGSDLAHHKPTYPSLVGLARAKSIATELHERAMGGLAPLGERGATLRELAGHVLHRRS